MPLSEGRPYPASKIAESTTVFRTALISRLILIILIITWRSLIDPYDTSASLNPKCLGHHHHDTVNGGDGEEVLWRELGMTIERSVVWDGVYFVRIAECGYEYEQSYAFLPLLPVLMYAVSNSVFAPLVPIIGYRAVLSLSGYIISNTAFVFAAVYFYRLSLLILKDKSAAFRASILFCFNPASIFYSSVYSESLYSLFSLGGLYHLISGGNTVATLLLALSGSARSNGVLNAGYFCFQAMHQAYDAIFYKGHCGVRATETASLLASKAAYILTIPTPRIAVQSLAIAVVRSLCIFAPFIAFQVYGYTKICLGRLSVETSPWCQARLPLLYNYLQSHYWGVGFLKYFQLKQLPNFLLASPILSLAFFSILSYAKSQPKIFFSLGFQSSREEKDLSDVFYLNRESGPSTSVHLPDTSSSKIWRDDVTLRRRNHKQGSGLVLNPISSDHEVTIPAKRGYSSILILPFVLHLVFMLATAFLVMHVQVATRFLSASPPLYWFSSYLLIYPGTRWRFGYIIWAYSIAYILLGSVLFSNFYPFT